jgi:glycosyltransferase involved in cell wall biosynthesis
VTRVAFIDQGWTGGRNYLRNLFLALRATPEVTVEPVLLVGTSSQPPADWQALHVETIRAPIVDGRGPTLVERVVGRLTGELRPGLGRTLRRARADVLSHSGPIGRRRGIPAISWIPDFQHRRLPQMFSEEERRGRDAWFELMCRLSARVIVSSETTRADLGAFCPRHVGKARVLRFVDSSTRAMTATAWPVARDRYGLPEKFFLLPNQFWAHKNHRLVVSALALLRERGDAPAVVATGPTEDHRNPSYFGELMEDVRRKEVGDEFRVLGAIPYEDLAALMRRCVAIVNPSLFEGWSTSIEEAKSLGKSVILSNIPVHREQAPRHATFVDPTDPSSLAAALVDGWQTHDAAADARRQGDAETDFIERQRAFALEYAAIVREVT